VKIACKDLEGHNKKMKEYLMMSKVHLDAALKQIANLTALINAQLYSNTNVARSVQLDSMTGMFKFVPVCPGTIKMLEFNSNKENDIAWRSDSFYAHNTR